MPLTSIYRPQSFFQIKGQTLPKIVLQNIAKNPKEVTRTLILAGGWGSGKSSSSFCFVKALNCKSKTGDSCNNCESCDMLNSGDTNLYKEYDSTRMGNIESIRDLRDEITYSVTNGYRVVNFDECLAFSSRIRLSDGTFLSIGKIVTGKLPVEVLSYNIQTNKVESKKVINWFKNSQKQFYTVKTKIIGTIYASENHLFITPDGNKPLKDLKIGDKINKLVYSLSNQQKEFLLGTLLGDGSLGNNKTQYKPTRGGSNYRLRINHSVKQKKWIELKQKVLSNFVSNNIYTHKNEKGYGGEVLCLNGKSLPIFNEFYNLIYKNGKKTITQDLLNLLTPLSIAVWYLDDGAYHVNFHEKKDGNISEYIGHISLSTHAFSYEENLLIVEYFKKVYDIEFKLSLDKRCNKYSIYTTSKNNVFKFLSIVSPYMVEGVLDYKLNGYFKPENKFNDISNGCYTIIEDNITSINLFDNGNKRSSYDIEVEDNHNYFSGDILVHNCHAISKASQTALLKTLEDAGGNIFFLFTTTDPDKLLDTIKSRSIVLNFECLSADEIREQLHEVSVAEKKELPTDVSDYIVRRVKGHARDALQQLELFYILGYEDYQKQCVLLDKEFFNLIRYTTLNQITEARDTIKKIIKQPVPYIRQDFEEVIKKISNDIYLSHHESKSRLTDRKVYQRIIQYYFDNHKNVIDSSHWFVFLSTLVSVIREPDFFSFRS